MKQVIQLVLISTFIFLLTGCANTQSNVNYPSQPNLPNELITDTPEVNITELPIDVVLYSTEDVEIARIMVDINKNITLVNCGNNVYSPEVADKVNDLIRQKKYTMYTVVINTTDESKISGCGTIFREVPGIKVIEIVNITEKTKPLNDSLKWANPQLIKYYN
jgi:hypothetical protein